MLKKAIKLVTNNFGLKILAVFFALILWLAVVNIDDPEQTKTFTTSVSIENEEAITDLGKYYEIADGGNTVTFKVTAKRSILRALSSTDFRAIADMSRIEELSRVPIDITATRYTSSVSFQSKEYYLEVSVEDLQTKQLVINAEYVGTPADGCAVDNVSLREANVIKISGPQSVVSTIASAKATINVEGVASNITDSVVPTLWDEDGNQIDTTKLKLSVQTVDVRAEIKDVKTVGIMAVLTGTPADGYINTSVKFSPSTIEVKGIGATLNTVNTIEIPEGIVNIEGATETVKQTVEISAYLPEGISLVNSEDKKVEVTVTIEPIETRMLELKTKNITVHNVPDGYRIEYANDTVKVYVKGLEENLQQLSPENVNASIDVAGLGEGEYSVAMKLELDEDKYSTNGTQSVKIRVIKRKSSNSQISNTGDDDSSSSLKEERYEPEQDTIEDMENDGASTGEQESDMQDAESVWSTEESRF